MILAVAGASAAGSAGRLPCPAVILHDLPTGYAHRDDSVMQHVGVAVSDGCMQRRAGMSGRPGTDSRSAGKGRLADNIRVADTLWSEGIFLTLGGQQ